MDKNTKRGILSNIIGFVVLGSVSKCMDLTFFAGVSLAINWIVFLVHGLPQNSEKFFDATGSLTYLVLVVSAVSSNWSFVARGNLRQIINPMMLTIWCVRLGTFLLSRILHDGKDSRFDEIKKSKVRFLGVWTIQSIWCFLVASPVLVAVTSASCASAPSLLDFAGWGIWVFAFAFEVIADQQKSTFRADPSNKGKFITSGLWAFSRHPNYFGEVTMWIGICLSGSSCFHSFQWLAWLSPVTTLTLLMKVSGVPLLEKQGEKKWGEDPAYQWYMKHTPCIVPALTPPPPFKT